MLNNDSVFSVMPNMKYDNFWIASIKNDFEEYI